MKKKDYIEEQRKLITRARMRIVEFALPFIKPRLEELSQYKNRGQENHGFLSELWKCSQSPVGWCIYDGFTDPAHDDCLWCHKSNERK